MIAFKIKQKLIIFIQETYAYFSFNDKICMISNNFYPENENIIIKISFSEKKLKDYNVTVFDIKTISGSKTALIQKEYDDFVMKYKSDSNLVQLLYKR